MGFCCYSELEAKGIEFLLLNWIGGFFYFLVLGIDLVSCDAKILNCTTVNMPICCVWKVWQCENWNLILFFLAILALSLLIDVVAASSNCDLKSMFTTTNFVLLRLSSFCLCAYSIFFTAVLIIFVKWQLRVQKALQEGTVSWRLSRKLGPDRKRRMFSGPNLVKGLLNQMRNFLATFYWWFSC